MRRVATIIPHNTYLNTSPCIFVGLSNKLATKSFVNDLVARLNDSLWEDKEGVILTYFGCLQRNTINKGECWLSYLHDCKAVRVDCCIGMTENNLLRLSGSNGEYDPVLYRQLYDDTTPLTYLPTPHPRVDHHAGLHHAGVQQPQHPVHVIFRHLHPDKRPPPRQR